MLPGRPSPPCHIQVFGTGSTCSPFSRWERYSHRTEKKPPGDSGPPRGMRRVPCPAFCRPPAGKIDRFASAANIVGTWAGHVIALFIFMKRMLFLWASIFRPCFDPKAVCDPRNFQIRRRPVRDLPFRRESCARGVPRQRDRGNAAHIFAEDPIGALQYSITEDIPPCGATCLRICRKTHHVGGEGTISSSPPAPSRSRIFYKVHLQ